VTAKKPWLTDPRSITAPPLPVIVAIKAIAAGSATEAQQTRFMEFLITKVCGYHECTEYLGDSHATSFANGRARVAQYLMTYIAADIRKFKDDPSENA
jgi:hypothetical protein